jgi:anti-sigma-K factor RskA
MMAMKMRQSLAQLEQEFRHEAVLDRSRRESLRRRAANRSRRRTHEREQKRSSLRYWLLVLSLIATALIVTAVMFESLYYLLG